jgi:hypothetical protein
MKSKPKRSSVGSPANGTGITSRSSPVHAAAARSRSGNDVRSLDQPHGASVTSGSSTTTTATTDNALAEAVVVALADAWFTCACGYMYSEDTVKPKAACVTRASVASPARSSQPGFNWLMEIDGVYCECGAHFVRNDIIRDDVWVRRR